MVVAFDEDPRVYNFNRPAVLAAAICLGLLTVLSLSLAPHDTLRGFRELFEIRPIRNLWRSILRYRPRYTLAFLLMAATFVPPLAMVVRELAWPGIPVFAIILGYTLIVVCPLIYWFVVEAFGPGPRERWRAFIDRTHRFDKEAIRGKADCRRVLQEQNR